ncbi:MFS transporter [Bacillus sp. ISL-40]|uniref:MFS transporter n=1 Tax=unclassified Bacillus (in: firmicutes) TaxID=185979 RepID=UPI001BE72E16|nr:MULTISPECIES: MFS transporter [unclassified Bacillus (in: firmicutes)]MBT2696220.1 MFS transporter [Bacillus sp. ISL-40]MBT2720375.1 MFS transporter [Bacillus sp. ISL-46]MBT2743068.1 MFS transporter [Bacillus sp. ISL-77]
MRTYNEKVSIYHGMVSTIAVNLASNFFPIFAISILGASNYQVGLISSLPPLVALIMTIPAAFMLNRLEQQKKTVAMSVLWARILFVLLAGVLFIRSDYQAWAFLIIVALMNVPGTISNIGWQTLISGMIKEDRRGAFFSDRNRLLTIVGMITTLIIGIVMKNQTNHAVAYQLLFLMAFLFGLLEVFFLMRHKETVQPKTNKNKEQEQKNSSMDWSIFKDNGYKWFLITALCFNFSWQMTWGLFNIYNVKYAHATILWISIFSVANQLVQIFSFPLWKRWAEQKSNTLMLVWVAAGMATAPFLTVLSTNLIYLTFVSMTSGFFLSGTMLLLFNLLLEQSPKDKRTYCITTYNVLLSFVAFIAPQIGIWLLEVTGIQKSMNIISILRFISAIVFFLMYVRFMKNKKLADNWNY